MNHRSKLYNAIDKYSDEHAWTKANYDKEPVKWANISVDLSMLIMNELELLGIHERTI